MKRVNSVQSADLVDIRFKCCVTLSCNPERSEGAAKGLPPFGRGFSLALAAQAVSPRRARGPNGVQVSFRTTRPTTIRLIISSTPVTLSLRSHPLLHPGCLMKQKQTMNTLSRLSTRVAARDHPLSREKRRPQAQYGFHKPTSSHCTDDAP